MRAETNGPAETEAIAADLAARLGPGETSNGSPSSRRTHALAAEVDVSSPSSVTRP